MSSQEKYKSILVMTGAALLMNAACKKEEKKRRRWWQTPLYKKRQCTELLLDLKSEEISGHYRNFTRMSPSDFEDLLQRIGPQISRKDTYLRPAISAQDR